MAFVGARRALLARKRAPAAGGGGGGANLITLDGSAAASGGSATSTTISITTSQPNDLILLAVQNNDNVSVSVTSPHLTWTYTIPKGVGSTGLWSAFSTGALTTPEVVTITFPGTESFWSNVIWGLNGVPSSGYFDPNGALPGLTSTTTPLTLTTSNANDFLFAAYADNSGAGIAPGTGWTLIPGSGGNFMGVIYKLVTATQSATPAAVSGGTTIKNGVGHAVKSL
jgi:hypothetical protein